MISGLHRSWIPVVLQSVGCSGFTTRILRFHIWINELRRPAVSVYRLCDQIAVLSPLSVTVIVALYTVSSYVSIFLPIIFSQKLCIHIRPPGHRSVSNITCPSAPFFASNTTFPSLSLSTNVNCSCLSAPLPYKSWKLLSVTDRTSFVDISEYDAVHIFSALRLCFRAQCTKSPLSVTMTVTVCSAESYCTPGCTFHLGSHNCMCLLL